MIRNSTEERKSYTELLKPNTIVIVSDVNSDNKDSVFEIFDTSTIFINKKFDMPINNNEIISGKSNTISKVNMKLTDIGNDVINKKSIIFSTESQFKNFKVKILFWCYNQFKDVIDALDNNKKCVVSIYNSVSKHELIFIEWLAEFGATIFIVDNTVNIVNSDLFDIEKINLDTNEHIEYSQNNKVKYEITNLKTYESLDELEQALYVNNEIVKVNVIGTENYIDTCNFYAKIYETSNNESSKVLLTNGFDKPSLDDTKKIQRFSNTNTSYIIKTLSSYIDISDKDIESKVKEAFINELTLPEYSSIQSQQLYNKCVYIVCVINNLFKNTNNKLKQVAYYGCPSNNDIIVLNILVLADIISVLVLCSDKNKKYSLRNISTFELSNSVELFPIPTIDKRNGSFTMAANAQKAVDQALFSGDTLGMYKPGQFRSCTVKRFNTTFDEIIMWWNKDMYIRPGFEANGDVAVIPAMFNIIKGVNSDINSYIRYIQSLSCGKTMLVKTSNALSELSAYVESPGLGEHSISSTGFIIHDSIDSNADYFNKKPLIKNNKLVRDLVRSSRNYKYKFIDRNKQDLIFDAIDSILQNNYINIQSISKNAFADLVVNTLLNLNIEMLQNIQWFEFYTYNPNLIITLTDTNIPNIQGTIIAVFASLIGFDVLVFVPTAYASIENNLNTHFEYNIMNIGEAVYDIDTLDIRINSNPEVVTQDTSKKKKGFFDKLFNK